MIIESTPPSNFTVPFLLRRQIDPVLSHSLALEGMSALLNAETSDLSILYRWFEHLGMLYAQNGTLVAEWDYEACLPLIPRSALLSEDMDTAMMPEDL